MKGPPLGPAGEDITRPNQVAPRGRKASSTRNLKPQTSKRLTHRGLLYISIHSMFSCSIVVCIPIACYAVREYQPKKCFDATCVRL